MTAALSSGLMSLPERIRGLSGMAPLPLTTRPNRHVLPLTALPSARRAALTGLHKNTIRAYIKQGRVAAGVVRGKYGQEYRLSRAEVVALATEIVSPVDLETSGVADAPAQFEGRGAPGASPGVEWGQRY